MAMKIMEEIDHYTLLKSQTSQAVITWSVVVDPRNVVHALSISLVNFIGDGTDFA